MVDVLKRTSAESVNAVMPYHGYARQIEKRARANHSKTPSRKHARSCCGLFATHRRHVAQIRDFDIPVDHFDGAPLIADYFERRGTWLAWPCALLSPDHGKTQLVNWQSFWNSDCDYWQTPCSVDKMNTKSKV